MWGTVMGPHSSLLEENSVVLKPTVRSSERRVCARLRARAPEDVVHEVTPRSQAGRHIRF